MSGARSFVFLQGPPGPVFRRLGDAIRERGHAVYRINLSGGDRYDWPDASDDFRGRASDWPVFFDKFLQRHAITDLILFGDCRPLHIAALGIAARRNVRTHVLEEGYLRPDWMTFEREGVNARSRLSRDKDWFVEEADRLPAEPAQPPVTAAFRRRARDSFWYYAHVELGRWRFSHFHSHRPGSIAMEFLGWAWRLGRRKPRGRSTAGIMRELDAKTLFLLPLQLSGDYQIRAHSPFADMQSAAKFVLESFAAHADPDAHLLIKGHPLDCSFFNWPGFVRSQAHRLAMQGRLHYVDGGDLEPMVAGAKGLVCVNSTSATLALANGVPVCTIGEAIYDMPGLTHQGHLDEFWAHPTPPDAAVYTAFRRVLVDRCLVRGGLASESAVTTLIASMIERLGL